MKTYIPVVIAAALLMAACNKKEEGRPDAAASVTQQQGFNTPPSPERPAPDGPKGAVPELPKPGQVNNHSSPEFKGGGVADSK